MDRRSLLRGLAPLAAGVLAGCLGSGPGSGDGADGDDGADGEDPSPTGSTSTPTPSPTLSPTSEPSPGGTAGGSGIVDRSFAVIDADCGSGRETAAATADGSRVTVSGTITGSDACHTARLGDVSWEGSSDRLRVGVESYVPETTRTAACAQCLVDIDYEATVTVEDGLPGTVVVDHDGETVASITLPA